MGFVTKSKFSSTNRLIRHYLGIIYDYYVLNVLLMLPKKKSSYFDQNCKDYTDQITLYLGLIVNQH